MDRIAAAQVFVAINERGSLIAAAEALDMSRAMVTRYLAQMEQWAGARLLHRTTRQLGLTAAGEATLARCRQMLEIAESVPVAADVEPDEPRGILRMACAQSLGQAVVAPAVAAYLQRYPRTAVDLQIGNQAVDLVRERIDLAIRITNQLDPNLIARPLAHCESVVHLGVLQSSAPPRRWLRTKSKRPCGRARAKSTPASDATRLRASSAETASPTRTAEWHAMVAST